MRLPSGVFNISYLQDMRVFRTKQHWISLFIFLLLLFFFPLFANQYLLTLMNTIAVSVIAVQGLNILAGYCGQISIGHSAFMAGGAYTSGILAGQFGLPFWLCLPFGSLSAGLVGVIFGLPSLKVKGFYLALTTIAAQFIILYLIKTPFPEVTGGPIALHMPKISLWGFVLETEKHFYYLIIIFTILMTFLSKSLMRSYIGRAFVAIRDNDIAAEAMGINLYRYKLLAFFIGCLYAGVAGCIWAFYAKVISPDDFTLMNSVWQMGMIIVGGLGSTLGPFFGVIIIKALNEMCILGGPIITSVIPQIGAQISAALVEMVFGITLVLFLIYEPRGLAHRWEILKESYRLWPFSF